MYIQIDLYSAITRGVTMYLNIAILQYSDVRYANRNNVWDKVFFTENSVLYGLINVKYIDRSFIFKDIKISRCCLFCMFYRMYLNYPLRYIFLFVIGLSRHP